MITTPENIKKGMALLDKKKPGWEQHINLLHLNIGDSYECVLGQLYGSFQDGIYVIFEPLTIAEYWETADKAIEHGFLVVCSMTAEKVCTQEWKDAIEMRLLYGKQ